jgi:hypothetical protein
MNLKNLFLGISYFMYGFIVTSTKSRIVQQATCYVDMCPYLFEMDQLVKGLKPMFL